MEKDPMIAACSMFFFLSFFLLMMPPSSIADEPAVLATAELVVVYDKGLDPVARQLSDAYPSIKEALESGFEWPLNFRPTLVLINDRKRFQRLAGHDLVVGYALPEKQAMVIDYSRSNTSSFRLPTIVKHELCHLLLHHHIKTDHLPRWLDEGICQWASDGVADILMNSGGARLPAAVLSGSDFDLANLADRFPRDKNGLFLAYEQSKSVVAYMGRQYGPQGIRDFLVLMSQGMDIDSAFKERFSISFETFENRWRNHLKESINWFTYLSIHLYEILFVSAALLTVWAFVRHLLRKKAYEKDDRETPDM